MNADHQLKSDVLAELAWAPGVNADHIGVTADHGVVTLTGHVDAYWQKLAAEKAVGRVQGIKGVTEEIEIRLPDHIKRTDDEIAEAALDRLAWESALPKDAVKVKVENGYVTLTGEVEWRYQWDAAARMVRSLGGVTGVSNWISIKSQADTTTLHDDIVHALHRSWFFDKDTVHVSAVGGKVHLTGVVDSWVDRQTAAETAWKAAGTTSVQNDIRVS
jgi:osmotically-inducible protein OsmY